MCELCSLLFSCPSCPCACFRGRPARGIHRRQCVNWQRRQEHTQIPIGWRQAQLQQQQLAGRLCAAHGQICLPAAGLAVRLWRNPASPVAARNKRGIHAQALIGYLEHCVAPLLFIQQCLPRFWAFGGQSTQYTLPLQYVLQCSSHAQVQIEVG